MTTVFEIPEAVLEHFGVKGMKWGVRNDKGHEGEQVKTKQLKKLDKKWDKENTGQSGYIKIHNAAANVMNNGGIDAINNKPEYKNVNLNDFDSPLSKKYMHEYETAFNKAFAEAGVAIGMNPSGTKKYESRISEVDGQHEIRLVDTSKVKHEDGVLAVYMLEITDGKYSKMTEKTDLKHESVIDDVLEHVGVKGMRWGVRKDRGDRDAVFRKRAKQAEEVKLAAKPGQKIKTSGGKYNPPSDDAIRTAMAKQVAKKSSTDALSTKDLQDLVQRMNLEKQYNNLSGSEESVGQVIAKAIFESITEKPAGEGKKKGGK